MGKNDKKGGGGGDKGGKGGDKDGGKAKGAQSINVRHILVNWAPGERITMYEEACDA